MDLSRYNNGYQPQVLQRLWYGFVKLPTENNQKTSNELATEYTDAKCDMYSTIDIGIKQ